MSSFILQKSAKFKISELGYFWNSWADSQRNIILVVCGSATSWMLDNVIRDYGGLHGRPTETIKLAPFTLAECGGKYAITRTDEEDFLNKIEAFAASKMHNKTHSFQLVMITTTGIARGEHASIVNQSVVLDDLFTGR